MQNRSGLSTSDKRVKMSTKKREHVFVPVEHFTCIVQENVTFREITKKMLCTMYWEPSLPQRHVLQDYLVQVLPCSFQMMQPLLI
jgi:hypothetical protein